MKICFYVLMITLLAIIGNLLQRAYASQCTADTWPLSFQQCKFDDKYCLKCVVPYGLKDMCKEAKSQEKIPSGAVEYGYNGTSGTHGYSWSQEWCYRVADCTESSAPGEECDGGCEPRYGACGRCNPGTPVEYYISEWMQISCEEQ